MYKIQPMTVKNAQLISNWVYPDEYAIYSFEDNEDTVLELMCGEYFSCETLEGALVGYFCFGKSAQIPTQENYAFGHDIIDIGLGLMPNLCGCGNGYIFMKSGLDYAKNTLKTEKLRLVVAAFNKRAVSLYSNMGFIVIGNVRHKNSKMKFIIMQCTL